MAILTSKQCPECDLSLEERSDRRPVVLQDEPSDDIRSDGTEYQAREFRCLSGHVWLLVRP